MESKRKDDHTGGSSVKKAKMECAAVEERETSVVVAVLDDRVCSSVCENTVCVLVADVTDKRQIGRLIGDLSKCLPVPHHLAHLRRVDSRDRDRKPRILLRLASDVSCPALRDVLPTEVDPTGLGDVHLVDVSALPPVTRAQYDDSNRLWPTNFHEDKSLELMINGRYFDDVRLRRVEEMMRVAVTQAELAATRGDLAVGCVAVDPVRNAVVAVGADARRRSGNPLKHAVMVCVDAVAASQGGGAWSSPTGARLAPSGTPPGGYLCTGYDLYVTREPCAMCSMALVHSRVGRLFYGVPTSWGALGSQYDVHTLTPLNHHFLVFKHVLRESCAALDRSVSQP